VELGLEILDPGRMRYIPLQPLGYREKIKGYGQARGSSDVVMIQVVLL